MNINKIIFTIIILTLQISNLFATTQTKSCNQESTIKIPEHENSGIEINAKLCSSDSGSGLATIETIIDGKNKQKLEAPYNSSTPTLSIENKIDLNKDGVYDLALSTGNGKGGEGYFYWIRDHRNHYHPVGEYPILFPCGGSSRVLYSITPGSGSITSTWTYYEEINKKIEPVLLIEITTTNENHNDLTALIPTKSGAFIRLKLSERPTDSSINNYLESICATD